MKHLFRISALLTAVVCALLFFTAATPEPGAEQPAVSPAPATTAPQASAVATSAPVSASPAAAPQPGQPTAAPTAVPVSTAAAAVTSSPGGTTAPTALPATALPATSPATASATPKPAPATPARGASLLHGVPTPIPVPPSSFLPNVSEMLAVDLTAATIQRNTVVAFYGHPNSTRMGILGEKPIETMTAELRKYVADYDAANGDLGAVPAYHIIFGTAYPEGDIGYLNQEKLKKYIEYAREQNIIVIIDHQIGRYGVDAAMRKLLPWLSYPNVHLAFDPEWSTTQTGIELGNVHANDINRAQQMMSEYMTHYGIVGSRMLVVHQFNHAMITAEERVESKWDNVVLIHNADGYGPPAHKMDSWNFLRRITSMPIKGFKLFLPKSWKTEGFDKPMFTAAQVMALTPRPVLVMFQ